MNERIRELAKQNNIDITIDGMGFGEGDVEGFAELIVLECCEAMQDEDSYYGSWMTAVLKRHFGVE